MATLSASPVSHTSPDNDVVTCEVFIAAPRERVFQAISDPRQALKWWGEEGKYRLHEFQMDVRVGGKWSCAGTSVTMGPTAVHGEFLEVDPPRKLAYTWNSSWMAVSTEVRWDLEEQGSGTILKLTHSGFAGNADQAKNHGLGWTAIFTWLQSFVEKGETIDSRM
jgi:uncharacterized protein YndB with AHSA1/START domain